MADDIDFKTIQTQLRFNRWSESSDTLSSKELLKSAAKLQILGDPNVQAILQQKAQEEQKGATRSGLGQGDEQAPQMFEGVNEEGNQFGGRTEDTRLQGGALDQLLNRPSRTESESSENSLLGGGGIDDEELSNTVDVQPDTEEWNLLMELPRSSRRNVYKRMRNTDDKFNTTDLRDMVTKELTSIKKHKETLRQEGRKDQAKTTEFARKLDEKDVDFENKRTASAEDMVGKNLGKFDYYLKSDPTVKVTSINPSRPEDYLIGTKQLAPPASRHISENVGGAGSRSKEVQEMTKAVTSIDRQITDLSKNLNNPNADIDLIMKQIKALRARRAQLSGILPETSDRQGFKENVFTPSESDPLGILGN